MVRFIFLKNQESYKKNCPLLLLKDHTLMLGQSTNQNTFLIVTFSFAPSILMGGVDFSFFFDKLSNTCVPLVYP